MALRKRRRAGERVTDMTVYPEAKAPYQPSPACEEDHFTFDLYPQIIGTMKRPEEIPRGRHKLDIRQQIYKGKIEDFAIEQTAIINNQSHEVARIDCCGQTVHWHLWNRDRVTLRDHSKICDIPPRPDGVQVVNDAFERCYGLMLDEWIENLRRWDGGR